MQLTTCCLHFYFVFLKIVVIFANNETVIDTVTIKSSNTSTTKPRVIPEPVLTTGAVILTQETVNDGYRPLRAGDMFTAQELLPIAKKLREKAANVSNGKGIITSSLGDHRLAEMLFKRFSKNSHTIVKLKDVDIFALDALQALAQSGDSIDLKTEDMETLKSSHLYKAQNTDGKPIQCQFKLLKKKLDMNDPKDSRRGVLLLRKNPRVRKNTTKSMVKKRPLKLKIGKLKFMKVIGKRAHTEDSEDTQEIGESLKCRWRYECRYDGSPCSLKPECSREPMDVIPVYHKEDEHDPKLREIREMLGITILDEEVEKILSRRLLDAEADDPIEKNPESKNHMQRVEILEKQFNSIMHFQRRASTTPLTTTHTM